MLIENSTGVSRDLNTEQTQIVDANPLLAPQLITERLSRKGRRTTVLTDEGKQQIRDQFHTDFIVKTDTDLIGYLNQETFDRKISELKTTYQDTKAKYRTADQKYNYLTVKSLEMHRKRLVDAEVYASMSASNSPWLDVATKLHQSIKTEDGTKSRYSQQFILNALKPTAKAIIAQSESIAPDNTLLQKYLTSRVVEAIDTKLTGSPVSEGSKVQFDTIIYSALNGNTQVLADDLTPQARRQILSEAIKTETINNRALAQIDMYLSETTEDPSFHNSEILRIMKGLTGDPKFQNDRLLHELVIGNVNENAILEDPYSFINQLSQNTQARIKTYINSIPQQPFVEAFGLNSDQIHQLLQDHREILTKAQNPQEVMRNLYDLYLDMGMDRDIAILTLFDEPWINPELKENFIQEVGYTPEQATIDQAGERLGRRQRKLLKKITHLFGGPVTDINQFNQFLSSPKYRELSSSLREVMSPDYLKNWGDKWSRAVNTIRLAFNLSSFGGEALWIEHQLSEVLHSHQDTNNLGVGVDVDGDGLTDRQVSAAEAKNFAVRDEKTGLSSVSLDLNGDGLVDAKIATPSVTDQVKPASTAESSQNINHSDLDKRIDQPASSLESQINKQTDTEWLGKVQSAIKDQKDQPLTIKSLLGSLINPLIKGRVEACNEDKDWCQTVLGDNGVKFPGIVVWFVGIDDEKIGGRGDAIHGLAVDENGNVTSLGINRDTRVPGMSGMPGASINTAWFVDQKILEREGKYVYDPERGQQILQEATGLPADLVIEVSWNGLEEIVKLLYGVNGHGTIPITVSQGEEFFPRTEELRDKAGTDGKIHAGTVQLTPHELIIYLRERKGSAEGTFSREARQSDLIAQILQDALSKDPTVIIRILKDLPSVLEKMEEKKGWMRVTGNIPMEFDTDGDGNPELHEFAQAVQPRVFDSIQQAITHPVQWVKQIGNLIDGLRNRNHIVPSRDENNPAQLVSDGSKMILTEDTEGHTEENTNIVFTPDPTTEQKVTYWQRLRDWSRKTVLGKK